MDNSIDNASAVIASLQQKIDHLESERREWMQRDHWYASVLEHATDLLLLLNANTVIEYCSPSWERVMEYSLNEILGKTPVDFLHPHDVDRVFHGAAMFFRTPGAVVHREFRCRKKNGSFGYFEGSLVNLLHDPAVHGIVLNARDISERMRLEEYFKESLKEKETMLKEIHHRVKNNLQLISSMLGLQAHHIQDEHIARIFRDCKNRVKSMALIHEKLYQSKNLTDINFAEYITTLIRYLFSSYGINHNTIRFVSSFDGVSINIDMMIHLGLLINELVSNSLKHAFPLGGKGEIGIGVSHAGSNGMLTLRVSDSGVGFPESIDFRNTLTLGLQLVNLLTAQLNGSVVLQSGISGTTFVVTIPAQKH